MTTPPGSFWHFLRNPFASSKPKPTKKHRHKKRALLGVEAFEDRLVMSTLTVMSSLDPPAKTDGTLRAVLDQANRDAAAGKSDRIEFAAGVNNITLHGQELSVGTATNGAKITIDGKNAVTINGNGGSRVLNVAQNANVELDGLTIMGGKVLGTGETGGGINVESGATVVANHDNITENQAFGGGGIFNDFGTVSLDHTFVTLNSSPNAGGGIYNNGDQKGAGVLKINDSTIAGNSASDGAGLQNDGGTLSITGSAFAGNAASHAGGGMTNVLGSQATISNSTFAGNSAVFGGGVATDKSELTISNSTLANNSATNGGGMIADDPVTLLSTIVAGNKASVGTDVSGSVKGTFNLIGNGQDMTGLTDKVDGNQVGTSAQPIDPKLGALGLHLGGSTATMLPTPDSPAHNAGGALTAVSTPVLDSDNTIQVADSSFVHTPSDHYVIQIGDEQMLVTAVQGNTLTVQRGFNGTQREVHHVGDGVFFGTDQIGSNRVFGGKTSIGAVQAVGVSGSAGSGAVGGQLSALPGQATAVGQAADSPGVQPQGSAAGQAATASASVDQSAADDRFMPLQQALDSVFASDFRL
jgi:hypothetical protein